MRLVARTCGFIEVQQINPRQEPLYDLPVMFLHRTLCEFLDGAKVRVELEREVAAVGFNPNLVLPCSSLALIRTHSLSCAPPSRWQESAVYDCNEAERRWFRHHCTLSHMYRYQRELDCGLGVCSCTRLLPAAQDANNCYLGITVKGNLQIEHGWIGWNDAWRPNSNLHASVIWQEC